MQTTFAKHYTHAPYEGDVPPVNIMGTDSLKSARGIESGERDKKKEKKRRIEKKEKKRKKRKERKKKFKVTALICASRSLSTVSHGNKMSP